MQTCAEKCFVVYVCVELHDLQYGLNTASCDIPSHVVQSAKYVPKRSQGSLEQLSVVFVLVDLNDLHHGIDAASCATLYYVVVINSYVF